jgi:hypothetical protein
MNDSHLDQFALEIERLREIANLLRKMNPPELQRALRYLNDRFGPDLPPRSSPLPRPDPH